MIIEKIIGSIGDTNKKIDYVNVEWFERDKRLLKKVSEEGVEIGLRLHKPLNDGDILFEDDEKIIAVQLTPTELIKIRINDIKEMGRACFEIGNRHISPAIEADCVKIPFDEPTLAYLIKLGFSAEKVIEKFVGFIECQGHSHHHE
ncbi:urease accessory protein [Aequitasia blattaphilus]|uniref:Urease accessory protein UreE n=1 Tax=Aequitasia blattaphilus TaxID=2949332 RepID=A0ABT1E8V5_9FIRM|nr:urease accessory protein UreE [Aequitasia blattaphilus]MCP1102256.1 urease accessory protein UreE [Aequitasia blattaphilus]MCR8614896.1 urease accessory protein UreE [Aequitasia blattaphilus]